MTAQPEHAPPDPRARPIPRRIDDVAAALNGAKRMAFYREIGQAGEEQLHAVLRKWWMEAHFDRRPGRDQRLVNTDAGHGLRQLPDVGGQE